MKIRWWIVGLSLSLPMFPAARAADAELSIVGNGTDRYLQVHGDAKKEWRFQTSSDLVFWTNAPALGATFSAQVNPPLRRVETTGVAARFVRAVETDGLFDTNLLRSISLTFTNTNWSTLLTGARTRSTNVPCAFALDNGITHTNVGARYRGNTSFNLGGNKKSVNLDINYVDPGGRIMGYRAINLNNAAGDSTLMRETLYFNVLREYAPCPHGALAKLFINGAYWGVYSMVDQINNDLIDEWFPSHTGDRWRAPNIGVGGGGFTGGGSAFTFQGTNIARYTSSYDLKSDNSTNAWQRLLDAILVLNRSPADEFRDKVEDAFAVDRWLWFFAVENLFVDDDSYWNKGADYAFYYEPESGRMHPVEHDGNEAFASMMGATPTLSPVQSGTTNTRPLLAKLLAVPELRQRYLAHMRTVMDERFNTTHLTAAIAHYQQLSLADVIADPKKNFTMTGYSNELRSLRTYITNRYKFLTNHAELKPLPPSILSVAGPSTEPGPKDAPSIVAQVQAADGMESVWLFWRDKPYGRFAVRQMFDDGAHEDGAANDGWFGAVTTNFPAGHKIHYYIEARADNLAKAAAFSPARAEQQTYSYRVGLIMSTNTPVLINELMADNEKSVADPQGDYDDWIELRNVTSEPFDLSGCYLTDDPTNPRKWAFPAGTTIPAGGYLLVWADEDGGANSGLHASFKLDKSGEQVLLINTDDNSNAVLDWVTFGPQETDRSFGRSAADPSHFESMDPTPGRP
jgi:spore coat protein CotH